VTLPQGRNGLRAWRMAVLSTFREISLCRHVHRELMRSTLLDLTPIISATVCHQRNYVERYSRYMEVEGKRCMGAVAIVTHVPQSAQILLKLPPKGRGFAPPNR
jgi:hypothetical protein